jgi:hypothetical protein
VHCSSACLSDTLVVARESDSSVFTAGQPSARQLLKCIVVFLGITGCLSSMNKLDFKCRSNPLICGRATYQFGKISGPRSSCICYERECYTLARASHESHRKVQRKDASHHTSGSDAYSWVAKDWTPRCSPWWYQMLRQIGGGEYSALLLVSREVCN